MFIDYSLEFLEHKAHETLLDYSTQFQNKSEEIGLSQRRNFFLSEVKRYHLHAVESFF